MAKVTRMTIGVHIGRSHDFQSVKPSLELEVELEEGEDWNQVYRHYRRQIWNEVNDTATRGIKTIAMIARESIL